ASVVANNDTQVLDWGKLTVSTNSTLKVFGDLHTIGPYYTNIIQTTTLNVTSDSILSVSGSYVVSNYSNFQVTGTLLVGALHMSPSAGLSLSKGSIFVQEEAILTAMLITAGSVLNCTGNVTITPSDLLTG